MDGWKGEDLERKRRGNSHRGRGGGGMDDKRGKSGELWGQGGKKWGEEENVREKTLASNLSMLAHVQVLSPGICLLLSDLKCGANYFRWWWDEIAGTCRQFQWTG